MKLRYKFTGAAHWPDCTVAREDGGRNTAGPNAAGPNTAGPSAAGPNVRWPENTNQLNTSNSTDGNCAGNLKRSRDQHMCHVIYHVVLALDRRAISIT